MILFPNAKINLGLSIISKRPDNYHNLETVFYPINLCDALEILPCKEKNTTRKVSFYSYGMPVDCETEKNLVVLAYRLLDCVYHLPPIEVHLYKRIPTQAGLGGGSSDAAYTLMLLNNLFELRLSQLELERYASTLGADCAFFIHNKPAFAQGIGNVFTPIPLRLIGYKIVIIKPSVNISTAEAFARIHPGVPEFFVKDVIHEPINTWKRYLVNDFEAALLPLYPIIGEIKTMLYNKGAVYASMTGSGSAVYGIFTQDTDVSSIGHAFVTTFINP